MRTVTARKRRRARIAKRATRTKIRRRSTRIKTKTAIAIATRKNEAVAT